MAPKFLSLLIPLALNLLLLCTPTIAPATYFIGDPNPSLHLDLAEQPSFHAHIPTEIQSRLDASTHKHCDCNTLRRTTRNRHHFKLIKDFEILGNEPLRGCLDYCVYISVFGIRGKLDWYEEEREAFGTAEWRKARVEKLEEEKRMGLIP
jgi:hypothetical protein